MRKRRLLTLAVLVATVFLLSVPGLALAEQERITSFDSAITVNQDGSMRVENTIRAIVTGDQIQHGIYYDFPTIYANTGTGGRLVIDFRVLGVQRDGRTEPYTVGDWENGKRVKIGSADTFIDPGEHTWVLRFSVDRELGYFADHDELYWNVTGSGWVFPIERASASVTLPGGAAAKITGLSAYTGTSGSTASDVTTTQASDGTPTFATTSVLNPREGLTIVVGWPKGFVQAPTAATHFGWFLRDNSALIVGLLGVLLVFLYYMIVWYRYGKDPERGTVFALFAPPEGMSPGGVRYLSRMAHDSKTFTAALIDMAVKRYISIHQEHHKYWIERDTAPESVLSDDELALAGALIGTSVRVDFEQKNAEEIQRAILASKRPLEADYQPRFFVSNTGYLLTGILFSVGLAVLIFFLSTSGTASQFVAPIVVGIALAVMAVVFGSTLKSYTQKGRKLVDEVAGFKMYLSVTEKDRMNLLNPPDRTPEIFEKYLPFALALDVEQRWSEQFASVFAGMAAEGRAYTPVWYYGAYWNPANPAAFASSIGTGFSNAISASAVAPGTKSGFGGGGGGGGFSGGGGGGGGGGGW
ncbi:MAG: DUF2207 domain-containing protein [Caldiserica bacterium]|nr:DUF2207 domain-containing protein [Caldisericota bacterium]